MSYISLMNTNQLQDLDYLHVEGTIDFSNATLSGFPVDNLSIEVTNGKIEVKNGGITIAKVSGSDLWARILADESDIDVLQAKTQYLNAAANVSTFTGTIAVPAITLNGVDLNGRITSAENKIQFQSAYFTPGAPYGEVHQTDFNSLVACGYLLVRGLDVHLNLNACVAKLANFYVTGTPTLSTGLTGDLVVDSITLGGADLAIRISSLEAKTQFMSVVGLLTSFAHNLSVGTTLTSPAITLNGTDLNTRISSAETATTNLTTRVTTAEGNITTLQAKTQYQTAAANLTTFSGNVTTSRLAVGTATTTVATGYFVGGVTNAGSEQTIIRCISNNSNHAKIEIQSNNASGHLYEVRSLSTGDFDITDRTGVRSPFSIAGSNGLVSVTAGIQVSGGFKQTVTTVSSSPFSVLSSHTFLAVSTASLKITLNLPAITATGVGSGTTYVIKDIGGKAETNIVTIVPNGSDKIDGQSSYGLNANYAALTLVAISTTAWAVI